MSQTCSDLVHRLIVVGLLLAIFFKNVRKLSPSLYHTIFMKEYEQSNALSDQGKLDVIVLLTA